MASSPAAPGAKKLALPDLPVEILKSIFKHSSSYDLVSLSLVSKQFREVAAEHLYRSFYIIFPDDDDSIDDLEGDGLAGGLETFTTSQYDYVKHLREIVMDTTSGGEKGERAYRQYHYAVSCGKFFNTLLLLTLRKAKSLETFRWNIRVELSRPVFKALHNISALQELHIRMHPHASKYKSPPRIYDGKTWPGSDTSPPPTLSGFRNLKTLSILDMDSLDYIDELQICVGKISSSLKTLRLSFSEALANKSRKPPPEPQSDDESDQEEDFGQLGGITGGPPLPNPLAGAADPNGPSRTLKAQEEKKKQEAVLARIFGTESIAPKPKVTTYSKPKDTKDSKEDPGKKFINALAPIVLRLMTHVNPAVDGKEALNAIEQAAKIYLENMEKKDATSAESSTAKSSPPTTPPTSFETGNEVVMSGGASNEPGLFDTPAVKTVTTSTEAGVSKPEDIDVEEPEANELDIEVPNAEEEEPNEVDSSAVTDVTSPSQESAISQVHDIYNTHADLVYEGRKLKDQLALLRSQTQNIPLHEAPQQLDAVQSDFSSLQAKFEDLVQRGKRLMGQLDVMDASNTGSKMSQYVRATRGLTLQNLAIYLIPIKTSVLSRAIDLTVLESITLLNVGNQTPFWNLLGKENRATPLALRKIHTDNVTPQFLGVVGELNTITELYLRERSSKARVENTVPKTTVTIDQIRQLVLKKHASTLKVLMIRNDSSQEWDINPKTVTFLCRHAKQLEELAASSGLAGIHTLMRRVHNLTSLHALYIIQLHYDDHCEFVKTELRKFILDVVLLYPGMKLEYFACEKYIHRFIRSTRTAKVDKKGKGKEIDADTIIAGQALGQLLINTANPTSNPSPISNSSIWTDGSGINSFGNTFGDLADDLDDEDDLNGEYPSGYSGPKIDVVGLRSWEIRDTRIFEREILLGRL